MVEIKDLIEYCKKHLGDNYVYGTKGEILNLSKYNQLKTQYPKEVWNSDINKIGTWCADCSGYFSSFSGMPSYNTTHFKNNASKCYDLKNYPTPKKYAFVWKQGHIGIYIGDGKCYEAKGSQDNILETKFSSGNWTHWLLLEQFINYNEKENESTLITHLVTQNENLTKISKMYNTTIDEIIGLNKTKYPTITKDFIKVGWTLTIKKSESDEQTKIYEVKKGDNLTKISKLFNVSIDEIVNKNIVKYPTITRNHIQIGWKLLI